MSETYHIPALLPQTLSGLDIKPEGTYVDATFGGGGHSRAILSHLKGGHLYGFDQDIDAVRRAFKDDRFTMVYSNFRFIKNFMRYYGVEKVDGILADLGVSFHHFDVVERGFTFRDTSSPLDMRMNQSMSQTAGDIINSIDTDKLTNILKIYGELPNAYRVATAIDKARKKKPLETSGDLLAAVSDIIDPARQKKQLAQIYQTLRIVVNDEMGALRKLLTSSLETLAPGGRLVIITYHSIEDRLVKNFMRTGNIEGIQEKDFFGRVNTPLKLINSKPIVPDEAEIAANPRSRSAKLRIAQKL